MSGKLLLSFGYDSRDWDVSFLPVGNYKTSLYLKNESNHFFSFVKK